MKSWLHVDLHSHSIASGHAFNTINELAQAAAACGIQVLGITDHGPSMQGAPPPGYFEMFHRVPQVLHGVRILMGCEANIIDLDGHIDLTEPWVSQQKVLLAGLHARTPYPQSTSIQENTTALVAAIKHPRVQIISHPYHPNFPVDVDIVVDAACEHQTLLEVNLALFRSILSRSVAPHREETVIQTRRMLRRLQDYRTGFVVNSDAHETHELGADRELIGILADLLEFDLNGVLNNDPEQLKVWLPALSSEERGLFL